MKMARKINELRSKMAPEAQQRSEQQFQKLLQEMPLHELRRARGLSQKALAEVLHVEQPAIAKMEKRADMYILTLRSHIEAMGGALEIVARFPEGAVRIQNFNTLDRDAELAT